jgi:hypothetical protein
MVRGLHHVAQRWMNTILNPIHVNMLFLPQSNPVFFYHSQAPCSETRLFGAPCSLRLHIANLQLSRCGCHLKHTSNVFGLFRKSVHPRALDETHASIESGGGPNRFPRGAQIRLGNLATHGGKCMGDVHVESRFRCGL